MLFQLCCWLSYLSVWPLAATFDGKQHLLSLPVVNSIDYVLRFLKKLCRSLHCENLFSDQPITQHSGDSYQSDGAYISLTRWEAKTLTKLSGMSWLLVLFSAETSMVEDYHVDQSEGKRYSVDLGDSAFSSISSAYSPKASYGFRSSQQFSSGSVSMNMCRQSSTSPNTFPDSNRTGENSQNQQGIHKLFLQIQKYSSGFWFGHPGGYTTTPESQESKAPPNKDPTTWSVDDVVWFIRDADPHALGPHADVFRKHVN